MEYPHFSRCPSHGTEPPSQGTPRCQPPLGALTIVCPPAQTSSCRSLAQVGTAQWPGGTPQNFRMFSYSKTGGTLKKIMWNVYMIPSSNREVPPWYGSPGSTPFPSICKLLAAFLRSSLVFVRFLQWFWLPASHLLGTCYLLDDLST